VIPNMENTSEFHPLPEWVNQPQAPKPQADGVVMVRYPRNDFKFIDFKVKPSPNVDARPRPVVEPTSKKRKGSTYNNWVNGLKHFSKESDDLYTIAGTKDAIKKFTEWWE